jgi:hypothetical protein
MASFDRSDESQDSLDRIERQLAIEDALIEEIRGDERLGFDAREQLIREILARHDDAEFWNEDDWNDDDASAILVRKLDPKGPKGKSGVAVRPEVEPDCNLEDKSRQSPPRPS